MQKWTTPDSYFGATWPDYYVFLGQNRDSDALTRSNFRVALKRLGGDTGEDDNGVSMVTVVRESHWACGWIEWIAIHESNTEAIKLAEDMQADIDSYPCLDESDWSELEFTEAMDYWDSMSLSSKVDYCKDAGVSVFAARRSYDLPDRLYESLTHA